MQAVFWTAVLFLLPLATFFSLWERRALERPAKIGWLIASLCVLEFALLKWNQSQAQTMELDFDDVEPDVMVTLGLGAG